jgi:hypothetical protein
MVWLMRQLPDEFASFLKDSLRGARYVVRHGTRLGQEAVAFAPGVPDFARFADTVLTATEKTAAALLLRQNLDFEYPATVLEVFAALLAEPDTTRRRRLFVRLQYRLIEAVLRRLGVENVFISEHEIATAYDMMRRRHRKLLASLRPAREVTAAGSLRFWVAAAVTLGARHPLREIDLPRQAGPRTTLLEQAPAPYCLLIVALTGAILTARHPIDSSGRGAGRAGDDGLDSYIDSATAVVTARFDDLATQFVQPKAVDLLAGAFEAVLPFLP